nr:hypothetical protein [Tanacetum cinerariifolium]
MSPNSASTLLPNPQDVIPSLVLGSSTPIIAADKSIPDTPLVSQESSTFVILPSCFNNAIDDRILSIVPSEVNSSSAITGVEPKGWIRLESIAELDWVSFTEWMGSSVPFYGGDTFRYLYLGLRMVICKRNFLFPLSRLSSRLCALGDLLLSFRGGFGSLKCYRFFCIANGQHVVSEGRTLSLVFFSA